jgi:hypothetical protein
VFFCISMICMRAMSGRSWSMAASMLAVRVAVSLRAACLLWSTSRAGLALDGQDGRDAEAHDEHHHDEHGDLDGQGQAHAQIRLARPAQ